MRPSQELPEAFDDAVGFGLADIRQALANTKVLELGLEVVRGVMAWQQGVRIHTKSPRCI